LPNFLARSERSGGNRIWSNISSPASAKLVYGYMDDILLHGDGCKTEQRGSMAFRKYYPDEIKCPLKA
jgi:hypothetical protein